jgi:hypothetical protein
MMSELDSINMMIQHRPKGIYSVRKCEGINPHIPKWAPTLGIEVPIVATLALGSRPRQRGCKGAGQEEAQESHHILPGI